MQNLSKSQANEICVQIQNENNVDDNLKILIDQYVAMSMQIASKHFFDTFSCSRTQALEDFLSDFPLVVYQASLTFDVSKNCSFATYLFHQVRFHCLKTLNKTDKFHSHAVELTDFVANGSECSYLESVESKYSQSQEKLKILLRLLEKLPSSKHRYVISQVYFSEDKKTYEQVAAKLGVSKQRVQQIHGQSLRFFRNNCGKELTKV